MRLRRRSGRALDTGRNRLLFVLGGICVGLAAVLMAWAADAAQAGFRAALSLSPLVALGLTPAGFALAALLTRNVFPNAQGSGIPQVIAARVTEDASLRRRLVSLRIAVGKVVLLGLGLACGASAGREGPTVQVGAAILAAFGRLTPDRVPGLLLAGGAAGVAAAFNTPLAGIVFAIEELGRAYDRRSAGLTVAAIVAAGLTALVALGNYTYFGSTRAGLPATVEAWAAVVGVALAGGLLGGLFSRIVILFGRGLPGRAGRMIARRPVAFAAACGLGVALCGLVSGGLVYGTGYEEARAILHGEAAARFDFAPLKLIATVLTSVSGIPGGLFAPSLAVGAGLGGWVAGLAPGVPLGALVLVGMVAYLAGVLQAPLTSFVIVVEMTQDHALVIPLMVAAFLADAASRILCRDGLYHALAEAILDRAAPSVRT
ncbi:H(+)/Cl(-) exchange transporter ClcA [Methylobacterium jeotgali]|uniref:H(+)/Cl(-) exchange transporter ClcA n=4 Tax=Pseudomonadota TaxID=1224 RepID=A0ABQ4T1T0_9HYPH|nr:chloride channel protein [Methylobacterium sp.]GJE08977.1 H(+)/Cl(-) exchange transporter ClcA [Methylobacterium jeotgali]